MYKELVKTLRESKPNRRLMFTAADAIEELSSSVEGLKSTTNMVIEETEGRTVLKFEPKWIPVTERLPEPMKDVVLFMRYGKYKQLSEFAVGYYDDELSDFSYRDVTHWMPLPEPPKDGEA